MNLEYLVAMFLIKYGAIPYKQRVKNVHFGRIEFFHNQKIVYIEVLPHWIINKQWRSQKRIAITIAFTKSLKTGLLTIGANKRPLRVYSGFKFLPTLFALQTVFSFHLHPGHNCRVKLTSFCISLMCIFVSAFICSYPVFLSGKLY